MANFATQTISDHARIASGDQRDIKFRPGQPGTITLQTKPSPVPQKSQTETGFLGQIELRRPGSGTPVAKEKVKIGENHLALGYTATAADLAAPGDWTCRITNFSLINADFTTVISYISDFPLLTASFDIPLIEQLLSEVGATAAVRVHLESSNDGSKQSVASWSVPVANLIGGQVETRIHIPDASKTLINVHGHTIDTTFRLLGLNSDPAGLFAGLVTNPLGLLVGLRFDTSGALLKANDFGVPDINIDSFAISLTVNFDGTIVPECNVTAILRLNSIDVSGDVKGQVESALASKIAEVKLTPAVVRQQIETFFVLLMRLSGTRVTTHRLPEFLQGHIQSYAVQGNSLVATYFQVPQIAVNSILE